MCHIETLPEQGGARKWFRQRDDASQLDLSLFLPGRFPLTPALSLGERENRFPVVEKTPRPGLLGALPTILPLPKGEGRGEGEERVRTGYYSKTEMLPCRSPRSSAWPRWPV